MAEAPRSGGWDGVSSLDMMTPLTARQQQVLDLWVSGKTYREVAAECGISPETVNPHLRKIARKLGTTRIAREALAELAMS